jgi:hypothetical protein
MQYRLFVVVQEQTRYLQFCYGLFTFLRKSFVVGTTVKKQATTLLENAISGNRTPGPSILQYFVLTIGMGSLDFTTKPIPLSNLMWKANGKTVYEP